MLTIRGSKKLGVTKLHVEGDSLIVIKAISKGSLNAWHLQSYIANIIQELASLEDTKISHIKREGNHEVDRMST